MELVFQPFDATHFSEYHRWYAHPPVRHALGMIDEEWLAHVLNDDGGCEYAVFHHHEMVAEVGLVLPVETHPEVAITNLAVKPGRQRMGIGSAVLRQLTPLLSYQLWLAFVSVDNPAAQTFFRKNGWISCEPPSSAGMIRYIYRCSK